MSDEKPNTEPPELVDALERAVRMLETVELDDARDIEDYEFICSTLKKSDCNSNVPTSG